MENYSSVDEKQVEEPRSQAFTQVGLQVSSPQEKGTQTGQGEPGFWSQPCHCLLLVTVGKPFALLDPFLSQVVMELVVVL